MHTHSISIRVRANKTEVWNKLSQMDTIAEWASGIGTSTYSSENVEGIGAERTCDIPRMGKLVENVDEWQDEQTLGYTVEGVDILKYWHNTWNLQAEGDATFVSLTMKYEVKYGFIGILLGNTVLKAPASSLSKLLAEFKYFVENGRAATSKAELAMNEVIENAKG